MKITFLNPVSLGVSGKTVGVMEIVTVAFNLRPFAGGGKANVSVTLRCPETGHQEHFVYEDAEETPKFWAAVHNLKIGADPWLAELLRRLIGDGKLPQGDLS